MTPTEQASRYMIANEYDIVFKDNDLTTLMINSKGNRNLIPKKLSYPIYKLLSAFLANYNIHIGGAVMIGEYEVKAITITPQFDVQNELILRQLYGFSNAKVNIQLAYRKSDEDIGAYAFWYNLTDYSCTLEKYVYGDTKESKRYEMLSDMLEFLRDTRTEAQQEEV